jgi:hypothetical protein
MGEAVLKQKRGSLVGGKKDRNRGAGGITKQSTFTSQAPACKNISSIIPTILNCLRL